MILQAPKVSVHVNDHLTPYFKKLFVEANNIVKTEKLSECMDNEHEKYLWERINTLMF